MKNRLSISITLLIIVSTMGFTGCGGSQPEASTKQIAEVKRGDLLVTITADGSLDMPRELELSFGTYGTIKKICVEKGQKVKEGQLLAKMDDTIQKINIAVSQYNVELAMNELVEKIHPALMGYPENYPDTSTVLRVEQAQEELLEVQNFLGQTKYQDAAAELRLAIHDLEASYEMLNIPEIKLASQGYGEFLMTPIDNYPDITRANALLRQDLERLAEIQLLINQGNYEQAIAKLSTERSKLTDTYSLVKSLTGRIRVSQRVGECCQPQSGTSTGMTTVPYPDTSTSLDWLKQVEEELKKMQSCKEEGCDDLEMATLVRMAQHDVEMSQAILQNNELIFRSGLNLKALRTANLNLQIYEEALKGYKEQLMWTEILSPFDGTVVDIYMKEGQEILTSMSVTATAEASTQGSAVSTSGGAATRVMRLVDTRTVKMEGVVDEVDIYKVQVGQDAIITVDALSGVEMKGKVTFISPLGNQTTGVVEFPVTISLDPTETELKGGLTATADIIIDKHQDILMVPNRAIKGSVGDYWVDVVIDEEKVTTEKRVVTIGVQNDQFTEIVSGLNQGEKVIVEATRSRTTTLF